MPFHQLYHCSPENQIAVPMNKILVIVVTYNGMKWVDRCFGSLVLSDMPVDVMAVDNGSTDGTAEYIRDEFPEVRLCCTGENNGFGKANNIGFRYALDRGYEYVYLLNQDAWVFPDTFGRLVAAMESDEGLGILSPMQLTASADRLDPRFARWCPSGAARSLGKRRSKGKIHKVKFVMAAHWLVCRRCLADVGGFSPAFPHYGEDDNYIHRALSKGYKVGIHSGAKAVHDREMRPMSKEAAMRLKCVASVVKVSNPSNILWLRLILQPLELLAISIRYRSSQVFRFIFSFIGSFRKLIRLRRESMDTGAFL